MPKRPSDVANEKSEKDGAFLGDTIECGVCTGRMFGRILSCREGHCVCEECHQQLSNPKKCPQCRVPFPPARNRALETIVEKCTFACEHGCGTVAQPPALLTHQSQCELAPVVCPISPCEAKLSPIAFVQHLQSAHPDRIFWADQSGSVFKKESIFNNLIWRELPSDSVYAIKGSGQSVDCVHSRARRTGDFLHIRLFHFGQERQYRRTLGVPGGPLLTLSAKTEPIWASKKSGPDSFSHGLFVPAAQLATLAKDGSDKVESLVIIESARSPATPARAAPSQAA